jgi:hypothetical protein
MPSKRGVVKEVEANFVVRPTQKDYETASRPVIWGIIPRAESMTRWERCQSSIPPGSDLVGFRVEPFACLPACLPAVDGRSR